MKNAKTRPTGLVIWDSSAAKPSSREDNVSSILRIKRPVRKFAFVNPRAAARFRILSKQAQSGAICELLCHKNHQGLIDCFTYTITEEF